MTATTQQSTRDKILYSALRVIGDHGIAGLTNRRVAAEAHISLGSLTYHFASQTDLLREALLLFVADEAARITAIADELATSVNGVAEAAVAAERALNEMALGREELGVYEVYVHSARDPELHEAAQRCFAAYDHVATTTLQLLGVAQPERVARHVVALVSGTQLRRLATGAEDSSGIAEGLLLLLAGTEWHATS
jgi:DNA-binding transcriptional regulator YbjK